MNIKITMHDVCYALEALRKHVKTEEYRPEHVQETLDKFQRIFDKMADNYKPEAVLTLIQMEVEL